MAAIVTATAVVVVLVVITDIIVLVVITTVAIVASTRAVARTASMIAASAAAITESKLVVGATHTDTAVHAQRLRYLDSVDGRYPSVHFLPLSPNLFSLVSYIGPVRLL